MKTIRDPDILTPGSMGKQTRGTLDSREKVFFKEEGTACLKSLMASHGRQTSFNLYISKGQRCCGQMLSQDRFNLIERISQVELAHCALGRQGVYVSGSM